MALTAAFHAPSPWQRLKPVLTGFDGLLLVAMVLLGGAGLVTMYSAGFDHGTRFVDDAYGFALSWNYCSWEISF